MTDHAKNRIPELLAPAGGMVQLRAAVQNGADAVYMGGPLFNARIKADNFTHDDMRRAIEYAHERSVKVYVTLNTLIKDDELERAFSYVNFLYEAGADAVIVQDMGIGRLISRYLPELPQHLSTQGTVYNRHAVDTVKELGFSRIVPARELTLTEIESLTAECHSGSVRCEVEVFVHGALCMCYSGQCQMSRLVGNVNGRSGNRGLCAQPCRLPYEDEAGHEGYLLSPKDICTVENIPQLCRAGVDSFKIEGRLKTPQYVAVVTSVYRKYLDMYRDRGSVEIDAEDERTLRQIFNRGGFSSGYLFGNPKDELMSGMSPKNIGCYVGKVGAVKKGSSLVDIEPELELQIGDGVEIYGGQVAGNVLSYVKRLPNGRLRIGDIKGRVKPGDRVYRVTEKALLKAAEATYGNDDSARCPVEMRFKGKRNQLPLLTVTDIISGSTVSVEGTEAVESARNRAMSRDRIESQLRKLGGTPFKAGTVCVDMEEGTMIAVSVINEMRRTAIEELRREKTKSSRRRLEEEQIDDICRREQLRDGKRLPELFDEYGGRRGNRSLHIYDRRGLEDVIVRTNDGARDLPADLDTIYVPLEMFMDGVAAGLKGRCEIVPYILNVSKGKLDRYIEDNFHEITERVRESGIAVGNLGWIKRFIDAGVPVYGDYGLNVYNTQALKAYEKLGVQVRECSHEMKTEGIADIPLMITEHPLSSGVLIDRKSCEYRVVRSSMGDKYMIFRK